MKRHLALAWACAAHRLIEDVQRSGARAAIKTKALRVAVLVAVGALVVRLAPSTGELKAYAAVQVLASQILRAVTY